MFREIILPIFRNTRLYVTACGIIHSMHYTTNCNIQTSVPEDGQNNCPKHVELTGIINKPLLLHILGCIYDLYQWCTVKQISDNEIYLLIKYIKSVLWKVAKRLSYNTGRTVPKVWWFVYLHTDSTAYWPLIKTTLIREKYLTCKKEHKRNKTQDT